MSMTLRGTDLTIIAPGIEPGPTGYNVGALTNQFTERTNVAIAHATQDGGDWDSGKIYFYCAHALYILRNVATLSTQRHYLASQTLKRMRPRSPVPSHHSPRHHTHSHSLTSHSAHSCCQVKVTYFKFNIFQSFFIKLIVVANSN